MASEKRDLQGSDELQVKRAKVSKNEPSQSLSHENLRVVLNPADCDIDFNVEGNGLQGSALYEEGFAYCWSGCRANIGITGGKYCFGFKILSEQPVEMEDTPLDQQHICRIGISRGDDAVRNLGESMHSLGFGGTGKFSNSGIFFDYGEKFGVGDIIVCAVDLFKKPMASIGFSKNGKWLGLAKHFDAGPSSLGVVGYPIKRLQWESALFPHVLLKNAVVQMQFSIDDGLIPEEGYKPWVASIMDGNSILGPGFSNQNNCEVIMMVGLPASGKTTWAEKWVQERPDKRYVLLGTDLVLEQMKMPGLLRKHNFSKRFEHLMDRATKIFNVLLSRASRITRNFILDQTNVYKSARKRKLKPFASYIKIAAVIFPRPEELKLRTDKRSKETGKEVPAEAVNEMLANYTLPTSKDMPCADEYFDQVFFVELSRAESQISLNEMKKDTNCQKARQFTRFQSDSGLSFQRRDNLLDAGDCGHNSYSYQNQSGPSCGKYFTTACSNDSRLDCDNMRSRSGYNCIEINYGKSRVPTCDDAGEVFRNNAVNGAYRTGVESRDLLGKAPVNISGRNIEINYGQSRVPTRDDAGEVFRNNAVNGAYRTGVESRDLLGKAPVNISGRNIVDPITTSLPHNTFDPITTSLPHNTCFSGYAVGSGGRQCDFSATRHPAYQPASPFPNGSYGIHLPRPPPPLGNFPTDVQHTGGYPSPSPHRPLHGNFPVDIWRPGFHLPPPWQN